MPSRRFPACVCCKALGKRESALKWDDVSVSAGVTIGKRYARTDELGVPFAVTVDYDTTRGEGDIKDTVTLRERDSTDQVRMPIADLVGVVAALCTSTGGMTWQDVTAKYPRQAPPSTEQ
jgi:glycyl-tRNA synthetase